MKPKRDNGNVKIRRTGKSLLMRFMLVMAAFAIFAATPAMVELFSPFTVTANAEDILTEGDYSYTVNVDVETVTLSKYNGRDAEVDIPATLGGKTVTTIGEEAFYECKSITSAIIPNTVTEIGKTAFGYCTSLTSVIIPNSVTVINSGAFRNCESLIYVTIPENVRKIGMSAFMYCESLISVTIPNSVISIGSTPFWGCKSLKEITVGENNAYYSVVDGALLNKAKTNLICYSVGRSNKTYTIPNGITKLGNFAFYYCTSLESVTLPNSLTEINVNIFRECTSLSSVTIPDSITKIGGYAFYHCDSLKDVYYAGTETQWNQIDIDYSGNDALKGATIHYNSTGNEPDIPDLYTIDFDFSGVNMSIKWGGSLFEHSSSEYDNNLAIAACALSGLAENKESAQPTKDLLLKMGFSESSIKSDHFDEWNPFNPAYVFANRDITVNGKTKKLVAVTIRGSQTILGDWVFNDFIDGMYSGFSKSTAAVYKALQKYFDEEDLKSVPKEDLIFFINGHSLGAAVVGSLTTIVSSGLTPQDNIFAYTIAAPKYANWGKQKKYTNLFETINKYDAVPILGWPGSSHYGVLDEFDPNQVMDFYRYWNWWENDTLKPVDILKNHSTPAYMSYLMTKDFFINDAITQWNDKYYLISVCCPVNVELFDTDDNLLGRVVDNVVDESVANENVFLKIEGDKKYIFVESDKEIYVKLVGTDSGTMEYSVQNLKAVDEVVTEDDIVTYKDVTLEKDKEFYSDITKKDGTADVSLYVVDPETNQFIKKVEHDGTEVPLDAQNTYTITFDTNGGTSSDNELITDASGKLSSLPTASHIDYTFDGWFTDAEGGEKVTVDTIFTENTTVYAHWTKNIIPPIDEKNVYEITFDANGGTSTNSKLSTDADGKLNKLPTASRTDYTFDGWFTAVEGGEEVTVDNIFTENMTVYAHWTKSTIPPTDEKNAYEITFDANGGTSTNSKLSTNADGKLSSLPTATLTDYTFDGWFTAAESGEQVTVETIFTENTTVYAHWTKNTIPPTDEKNVYEITFDANGGTSTNSKLSTDADGKLSKLSTAVRTNYVFDGWFTSVSGGAKITTDTVFTENTTVYAHWTNSGNSSDSTGSASLGSTGDSSSGSGGSSSGSGGGSPFGSTGGTSSDSTSSNETSSNSPDNTSTNFSGDEPFDSNSDTSSDSNDSNSNNGMSSPSDGTSDSDSFSASGESSNNSNGSSSDDSGNPSNNPPTGISVAIIPLLFTASASMVIFHKKGKK